MIYQETIKHNFKIREFDLTISENELVWHFDEENREIEVLNDSDWKFQFDGQLPFILNVGTKFKILKGVYHRLIKGTTKLKIKIKIFKNGKI